MKDQWSISKDKLVALEEGTSRNEEYECAKPAGRRNVCEQAIQCVKLILYLGLLMIVGWACYSMWQTYHAQPIEVKVTDIIPEPESQHLLEEQRTHETSTIAARPIYESEDSSKRQDAVDDSQKFVPDDQAGIIISENTESSLGWPNYTDYPDLPEAMNLSLFSPSLPSMEVDEKEPGSSDSAQRLFDNLNEESQQLIKDEKDLLGNYMLLSLIVQNAVRISERLKDSKEVVDPKFEFKLEDLGPLKLEDSSRLELDNSGLLEMKNTGPLDFEDLGPFEWMDSGPSESQKDIGSDLEDSEEKPVSTQTDDNHESVTLNILDNTHDIVIEDSAEPKQEETLIKSDEQMHQSMDSGVADWFDQSAFEEREHEEEQSLLEKSAVRNAEAVEDSSEEIFHNAKPTSAVVRRLEDSDPLEFEDSGVIKLVDLLDSLKWEDSGPSESQKDIGSYLEDSEEIPVSTQTDDNHESATLNILDNTHEIVPEDSAEAKQEETLIKSNEQMHQSIFSEVEDGLRRIVSSERNHKEDRATETIASDGTEVEVEDGEIPRAPFDFGDSIIPDTHRIEYKQWNTNSFLGLPSDAGGSSVKTESAKEFEWDSFDWGTYKSLLTWAQIACLDANLYSWELVYPEDTNNSHGSGVQDKCTERANIFCEYRERTLQLADCDKYSIFRIRWHDSLLGLANFN